MKYFCVRVASSCVLSDLFFSSGDWNLKGLKKRILSNSLSHGLAVRACDLSPPLRRRGFNTWESPFLNNWLFPIPGMFKIYLLTFRLRYSQPLRLSRSVNGHESLRSWVLIPEWSVTLIGGEIRRHEGNCRITPRHVVWSREKENRYSKALSGMQALNVLFFWQYCHYITFIYYLLFFLFFSFDTSARRGYNDCSCFGAAAYLAVTNVLEQQDTSHAARIARFSLGAVMVNLMHMPTHNSSSMPMMHTPYVFDFVWSIIH